MKALGGEPSLDACLRRTLDARIKELGEIKDATRRAWLLRESLDQVYAALDENQKSVTAAARRQRGLAAARMPKRGKLDGKESWTGGAWAVLSLFFGMRS